MSNQKVITGPKACREAKIKARYGRKEWIAYKDKSGLSVAERLSIDSLKRAMLATGTKNTFLHIGTDGHSMLIFWPIAVNMRNQLKRRY